MVQPIRAYVPGIHRLWAAERGATSTAVRGARPDLWSWASALGPGTRIRGARLPGRPWSRPGPLALAAAMAGGGDG